MNMSFLNRILNWSLQVCRLFGIPIFLHISLIFFLVAVMARTGLDVPHGIEYAVAIVITILLHELGHALTAKHYKMKGLAIMLHGFGGFASSSGYRSPQQALVIVLAGPAVTFAVGILCLTIGGYGLSISAPGSEASLQFLIVKVLGSLNILMGFLNLIPTLPFDGGQALRAILAYKMSEFKANRAVCHLGLILNPIVIIYGLSTDQNFIGLFGFIGLVTSAMTLAQTGGVKFGEVFEDRRAKKENEAYKQRERARQGAYLDEVNARKKEREERARLKKLFEVVETDEK